MQGLDGEWLVELVDYRLNLVFRPIVGCLQVRVFVGVDVGDDREATSAVIEDEDDVGDKEDHVRQAEVVRRRWRERGLEVPHHVVGKVTDGTAAEHRECGRAMRAIGAHEFFEGFKGVAVDCEAAFAAAFIDLDFAPASGDDGAWGCSQQRVTTGVLGQFSRFKKEATMPITDFLIG